MNVRLFLKWLKEKTGGDSSARMHGDKLILVTITADCFRARVRVLRSIDTSKSGVFTPTVCRKTGALDSSSRVSARTCPSRMLGSS